MAIITFLVSLLTVSSAVQSLSPGNRTLLKDLVGYSVSYVGWHSDAYKKFEGKYLYNDSVSSCGNKTKTVKVPCGDWRALSPAAVR